MARKIVKTFEEFVSFEIENSEVHIHLEPEEMMEPTANPGDHVIVDSPLINLTSKDSDDYSDDFDSEEEDETPESDEDETGDDEESTDDEE
jgi:hypothetical protein